VSKKEKEIVVRTPIFIRVGYERPEVSAIIEKLNFFSICRKISKYSSVPIIVLSLLFLVSTASGLFKAQFLFPKPLFVYSLISIGIMSILSGLLLLAKD
jgi:hypothetical protein